MKRFFAFFMLAATLFAACEPTIDSPGQGDEKNLLITESIINVAANGGQCEIRYTISQEVEGIELEATTTTEWISNIAISDKITFSVAANTSNEQRVGYINVSYGADEYTIGIQQLGIDSVADIEISLTTTNLTLSAEGGMQEVGYTLTGAEEGAIPTATVDNCDWISNIAVDEQKITFDVAQNTSTKERKAKLMISLETASASIAITQEASLEEVTLSASTKVTRIGQSVELKVMFAGKDVTSLSTIHEYYSNQEVANPATFNKVGDYALYAKYNGESSNLVSISVFDASAPDFPADSQPESFDFKHRMLLIDHTGTGCGYCPLMMISLKEIEEDAAYNDYFNLAVSHSFNSSDAASSTTSFMLSQYYQSILRVLTGYPTLTYNYQYGESAGSNINYIKSNFNKLKQEKASVAVAATTRLDGNKLVISTSLKSKEAELYKFNILLLEDNIYSKQNNASENWMNYHNNAIRDSYTDFVYTDITGTEWGYVGAESTTHKVLEFPIDDNRIVKQNCKILIIIAAKSAEYDNKFEVVNTTMCGVDQTTPFEYR